MAFLDKIKSFVNSDKAKGALDGVTDKVGDVKDKVGDAVEKGADKLDDATGGKLGDAVDTVKDKSKGVVDGVSGKINDLRDGDDEEAK